MIEIEKKINEDLEIHVPAILQFMKLGYSLIKNNNKNNFPIHLELFFDKVKELNKESLSKDFVERNIITKLLNSLNADNSGRTFRDFLLKGIKIEKKIYKIIDFNNPYNNSFYISHEQAINDFRPDLLIYINGIPISILELKKSHINNSKQKERDRFLERIKNNRIFFKGLQFFAISNGREFINSDSNDGSYYAASDEKFFWNNFVEEDEINLSQTIKNNEDMIKYQNEKKEFLKSLNLTENFLVTNSNVTDFINSLFSKERIIFILKHGIIFSESEDHTYHKQIMRYPQLFASLQVLKKIKSENKRGIIWHTQGSGKTALTMYLNLMLKEYFSEKQKNVRFFYIVDRIDLLEQTIREYEKRNFSVQEVNNKKDFQKQFSNPMHSNFVLNSNNTIGETYVVNIQKFTEETKNITTNKYIKDDNFQNVFFIDEAHRSYDKAGTFFNNLVSSDKNAIFIALTGTPILNKDATKEIFGDYFHIYFYDKSIIDGYTLSIFKENAENNAYISNNIKNSIVDSEVAKEVLESEKFLKEVVNFISDDFKRFRSTMEDNTLAAMVVCRSNAQVKKISKIFKEINKELNSAFLIDEVEKETKTKIMKDFKNPNKKIDIIIVNNMLTTGYDAPRLKKLYMLKPKKDHSLLQTISRVNRPYKNMKYGYLLDFNDITDNFNEAIQNYENELNNWYNELGFSTNGTKYIVSIEKVKEWIQNDIDKINNIFGFNVLEIANLSIIKKSFLILDKDDKKKVMKYVENAIQNLRTLSEKTQEEESILIILLSMKSEWTRLLVYNNEIHEDLENKNNKLINEIDFKIELKEKSILNFLNNDESEKKILLNSSILKETNRDYEIFMSYENNKTIGDRLEELGFKVNNEEELSNINNELKKIKKEFYDFFENDLRFISILKFWAKEMNIGSKLYEKKETILLSKQEVEKWKKDNLNKEKFEEKFKFSIARWPGDKMNFLYDKKEDSEQFKKFLISILFDYTNKILFSKEEKNDK